MTMTTANPVIEPQNAESHDAEKNIFVEQHNDGNRRVDDFLRNSVRLLRNCVKVLGHFLVLFVSLWF